MSKSAKQVWFYTIFKNNEGFDELTEPLVQSYGVDTAVRVRTSCSLVVRRSGTKVLVILFIIIMVTVRRTVCLKT
jgi:hypothetical protein